VAVNLRVANILWPVGAASFFTSFFSTIAARLEPAGWGTRFPVLMLELYEGEVSGDHAAEARKELDTIREELRAHPPSAVVWDIHDRSKQPPWGDNIADGITDLGNYFVTSDGRDLFEVLAPALDFAAESGTPLMVE
jgi:2,3-bisphosphoglycerate-dependent phosphoglycerate mutase